MSFVIRQIHLPGKSALANEANAAALAVAAARGDTVRGLYLVWSDPDAKFGLGHDVWTTDVRKAKRFPTFRAAMDCWKARSTLVPTRPDGKPNRPMTAYSITVQEIVDER